MRASFNDATVELPFSSRGPKVLGWYFLSFFVEERGETHNAWYKPPEDVTKT